MRPRASALEFGGLAEILQAPRFRPRERGNVATADAAACTAAAIAGVAGVAVVAPPTGAVIFGVAAVAAAAAAAGVAAVVDTADLALLEGADGAGGLPFATPPVSASASAAGALRVAGRTGPTPVMSRSDSLSKSSTLPLS